MERIWKEAVMHHLTGALTWHLPGGTEENQVNHVRTAYVLVMIQTEHLPNISSVLLLQQPAWSVTVGPVQPNKYKISLSFAYFGPMMQQKWQG